VSPPNQVHDLYCCRDFSEVLQQRAEVWDVAEVGEVQQTGRRLRKQLGTICCSTEHQQQKQPGAACQYGQIRDVAVSIELTRSILQSN